MRNAAGGTLPIPGLTPARTNRKTRDRKRREKSRKGINLSTLSSNDADAREELVAYRLDVLEEAGANVGGDGEEEDVEEEFDELEEVEGRGRRKGRKAVKGRKTKTKKGALDKRFQARSLASILIEESGRNDGVVREYVNAEARPIRGTGTGRGRFTYPKRKFCPVTGLFGVYTDPKTQIPYANLEALEQLRERTPPWLSTFSGGSAAYYDAVKSLRNED